jgi:iron complex transport system permease protein
LWGSDDASIVDALSRPGTERVILFHYRLPRVLLAAVTGGGLAVVGAAFQALLRNPLADPYVLGVSGGAAVGATAAIAFGLGTATLLGAALVPVAALVGGLAATFLAFFIARRAPREPAGATILLVGVMINAIAASMITFGKLVVPPSRAQLMLRWLVGFIELPNPIALGAVAGYVILGCTLLWREAGRMNVLALGDESAEALGVDVQALERRVFVVASGVVGAVVSLTGLIGFVGLVVPHAVRRLFGPDHRRLVPIAFVAGGSMLVVCDLFTRLIFRVTGDLVSVGAVTAVIGVPVFLWMLTRTRASR